MRTIACVSVLISAIAFADSVPRSTLSGGGVSTGDGGLVLRGAIGQPATQVLTGGGFTVIGGFLPRLDPVGADAGSVDAGSVDAGELTDAGVEDAGSSTAPRLTSITPNHGKAGEVTPVVVLGAGFVQNIQVIVGGALLSGASLSSAAVISGSVPGSLAAGSYDVVVANPDGQTATLTGGFTVEAAQGGTDAGTEPGPKGSCGCSTGSAGVQLLFGLLAALSWRRRR